MAPRLISAMLPLVQLVTLLTVVHPSEDALKVATTAVAAAIVTVQVPVPEQPPPDQPEKVEPLAALGVRTTLVP
jgi:hypothetical protein